MTFSRFTIRELLLVVTLVVVAIVLIQARIELADVRPELKRLRLEVGELDVTDNDNFYIVQVPTKDVFHWRWRVSLPDGFDCYLYSYTGLVPDSGFKTERYQFESRYIGSYDDRREFFLDLKLGKNYQGLYSLNMAYNNNPAIINTYFDGPPDWLLGKSMSDVEVCGDREMVTVPPNKEAYLLRIRTYAPGEKDDGEGILVWLSTEKNQSPRIAKQPEAS